MASDCDENPFALLIGLADRLTEFFDRCASAVGLTPAQAQALMHIEEPTRMGDLAHLQTCDPSTATAMVQRLERDGLVVRVIDPHDARARLVQLSPKGRRTRTRLAAMVSDAGSVIDDLPAEQRTALAQLFGQHARAAR
ncbi:MAG: MarR family winged helix-turn-helix transcriptional regulator [Actinomycetota bacterium]|nr:MarR family winged helix-turn-helix transcriptional regulator [Actinomycetota bacterium]